MAILDKLFGQKSLSDLDVVQLRKEEILLQRQRDKLLKKIEDVAGTKQKVFAQGAATKSPELRKALAMDFELKTQEQVLAARELNLRSKELLTVSRLRMMKESAGKNRSGGRLNLTDRDVARITSWIADDGMGSDAYNQRLDMILEAGSDADKDILASAGLTAAGQELMRLWEQVDAGEVKEPEALEKADNLVRTKSKMLGSGEV
jgi:hypothetical protein